MTHIESCLPVMRVLMSPGFSIRLDHPNKSTKFDGRIDLMSKANRSASATPTVNKMDLDAIATASKPTTGNGLAVPTATPGNAPTTIAAIPPFSIEHAQRIAAHGRDMVREAQRWDFFKQLWLGTKKVEHFSSFGPGAEDMTRDVQLGWGPFSAPKHFAQPFDGGDIPVHLQIANTPTTTVKVVYKGAEVVTEDGQKSIDLCRSYPEYNTRVTDKDYSMVYPANTPAHVFPAGTRLTDLTDKNLARLIWAVRESLPRVLKGADRNKYSAAVNILLGRVKPVAVPNVEGVDAETVRRVLAAMATK